MPGCPGSIADSGQALLDEQEVVGDRVELVGELLSEVHTKRKARRGKISVTRT